MDADGSRLTCLEEMLEGAAVEGGVPSAPPPADFVAIVAIYGIVWYWILLELLLFSCNQYRWYYSDPTPTEYYFDRTANSID